MVNMIVFAIKFIYLFFSVFCLFNLATIIFNIIKKLRKEYTNDDSNIDMGVINSEKHNYSFLVDILLIVLVAMCPIIHIIVTFLLIFEEEYLKKEIKASVKNRIEKTTR